MAARPAVHLRPVTAADLPWIFEIQQDPESNRMAMTFPRTRAAFDELWAKALDEPACCPRIILADDVVAGMISVFQRDGQDHVGYWIDKPHWGRGIAGAACRLIVAEVPRRPLHATAATSNAASLRVLAKAGFVVVKVQDSPADERHQACEEATLVLA